MSKNDEKIKALLTAVDKKREELGTKPKAVWNTNGVIDGNNINTLNSTEKCIALASKLLIERSATSEACKLLGVDVAGSQRASYLEDALNDLKLRVKIINWDADKKKLQALEKQLKDLRSEDAKTEDALADISKLLG